MFRARLIANNSRFYAAPVATCSGRADGAYFKKTQTAYFKRLSETCYQDSQVTVTENCNITCDLVILLQLQKYKATSKSDNNIFEVILPMNTKNFTTNLGKKIPCSVLLSDF